jgi:hypothetical protein
MSWGGYKNKEDAIKACKEMGFYYQARKLELCGCLLMLCPHCKGERCDICITGWVEKPMTEDDVMCKEIIT